MGLQVDLVSPERIIYQGEADMVVCRTVGGGEVAFMAGHAPFMGALAESTVRIKTSGGGEESADISGGFVEVSGDHVIILSEEVDMEGGSGKADADTG